MKINNKILVVSWLFFQISVVNALEISLPASSFERLSDSDIRIRQIIVPELSIFASADFTWKPQELSFVFNGNASIEEEVIGGIAVWKHFSDNGNLDNGSIEFFAGGFEVTEVGISNQSRTISRDLEFIGFERGIRFFEVSIPLASEQVEEQDGEYEFSISFESGEIKTKSLFVSGDFPHSFDITYPTNNQSNIPLDLTVQWESIGSASYDFILRDNISNTSIYNPDIIINSVDHKISHAIPSGILTPNTSYCLTIEAQAPPVNGGYKGIKKRVCFATQD